MIWRHFLVLGDSVSTGSRALRGWPEMVPTEMPGWWPVNRAITGQTTLELSRRCYDMIAQTPTAEVVFILTGANDARDLVPPAVAGELFNIVLAHVESSGRHPIVILPTPIIRGRAHPAYPARSADRLDEITDRQRAICLTRHVQHVDVSVPESDYADAVHLSDSGQYRIALAAAQALRGL